MIIGYVGSMGLFEWLLVAFFVVYGIKTYGQKGYPFDRWVACLFKRIRTLLRRK
jgi:hypothetical protein